MSCRLLSMSSKICSCMIEPVHSTDSITVYRDPEVSACTARRDLLAPSGSLTAVIPIPWPGRRR